MNKLVKIFQRPDHQYTPEGYLQQFEAQMTLTMGKYPLNLVTQNACYKTIGINSVFLSRLNLRCFLQIPEDYKNDWSAFVTGFKKQSSSLKTA